MIENTVLLKRSCSELTQFFTKEYSMILIRILTLLNIEVDFPVELEDLIISIPESFPLYSQCNTAYQIITSPNIKSRINSLLHIYENLLKIEKDLSHK